MGGSKRSDRETQEWLLVSQAGNSPLRSQSSRWISETAVVGISVPAHSGRAAGHRAGKPAKSKKYQVRKRTPFFWWFQSPITANKMTRIQAVRLTVSMLKQNLKPKYVDLFQDQVAQEKHDE